MKAENFIIEHSSFIISTARRSVDLTAHEARFVPREKEEQRSDRLASGGQAVKLPQVDFTAGV
jgi:hypothetical protein